MQVIGIDLGGSAIKLGRFDQAGHCLQALTVPTPQPAEPQAVLATMVDAITQLDPHNKALAIGIGTPGPTDANGRVARVAINLSGWYDIPLANWIEEKTGRPTVLANDANCAGLGEYWLGAGRGYQNFILLTLGTGVGGAIILNGELFVGPKGTAGELGLITLDPEGPDCNSGNRGSLEQHASVQAIRRRTGLEPDELGRRAETGDPEAIAFWQEYGKDLGIGLASLIYVLTPEAIIIGGGVCPSAPFFFPSTWAELERRVLPSSREGLTLLKAELGNQAGIVGAAKLAWQLVEKQQQPRQTTQGQLYPVQPALELAYHQAVQLAHFKGGFLARTAHELRSPINSLISLHQLILADLSDDPAEEREFVAQAQVAARKTLTLLDEIISISKIEAGTAKLNIKSFPLKELLEQVYQLTHLQARNKNLTFEVSYPDPTIHLETDSHWLSQVLVNLLESTFLATTGNLVQMTTHLVAGSNQIWVCIDAERPFDSWSEPTHILQAPQVPLPSSDSLSKAAIQTAIAPILQSPIKQKSDGLTLLINQAILELLGGRLELLTPTKPNPPASTPTIRIQCSLPLSNHP